MAHFETVIVKSNKYTLNSYCGFMLISGSSDLEIFIPSDNQHGTMEKYTGSVISPRFESFPLNSQ